MGSAEGNKDMFSATDAFKWLKLGNTKINKEKEGFFLQKNNQIISVLETDGENC